MASEPGRGAQVRLDDDARRLARGGGQQRLMETLVARAALEAVGATPSGLTPDGSWPDGTAADDEVLLPGGLATGLGGGGVQFDGGAVIVNGMLFVIPPGPYADDADAAAHGVPLRAAYAQASGVVKVREV